MNKQPGDNDTAGNVTSTSQSELIAALEAVVRECRKKASATFVLAAIAGWNDAADLIEKALAGKYVYEPHEKQWQCTVEADGPLPDCVLDHNRPHECSHAPALTAREDCLFWKLV